MIRSEKRLAGLIQDLITHADFLNVEIEQVVVALERGTADHGQIEFELTNGLCGQRPDQSATRSRRPSRPVQTRARRKGVGHDVRFSSFIRAPPKNTKTRVNS